MANPRPPDFATPPGQRPRELLAPDLQIGEVRRGSKPGTRYVRVTRSAERAIRRTGEGRFEATLLANEPHSRTGRALRALRRSLFGEPLATSQASEERLTKVKALAVFSSDALSSSAYATEEILLALMLAGTGHLAISLPIAAAIAVLLLVVVFSYQQTVHAYPQGGGTYSVARENLGVWPGLVGASALLTDYVLTVAVSISAGTLAVVSALPALAGFRVEIALVALALLAVGNLRGIRESGSIFAVPTYLFILAFGAMIAVGVVRLALGGLEGATLTSSAPPRANVEAVHAFTLFLVLRAFASGSTALTGVEAIANGVPAFKPPESRNAARTMLWMGGILLVFFVGATFLATRLGIVPVEDESVISQIGRAVFWGESPAYYFLQATTALILILAGNTAFADFPRLASILARDDFLPRQFAFRGDRLAFSNGILVLSTIAAVLLVVFRADTHRLIPLYAIGVFIAFTLSQAGMFLRWRRLRTPGWRRAAVINGGGAVLTGVVAIVVAATKFMLGAWVVLLLIPAVVLVLDRINRHYAFVRRELRVRPGSTFIRVVPASDRRVIVPVDELDRATMRALTYARAISGSVTAVHLITGDEDDTAAFEERWSGLVPDVPLVMLEAPDRSFQTPFIAYIDAIAAPAGAPLTVVLPEFVTRHWYERYLHNGPASRLRDALHTRPNTVVVSVTELLDGV